MYASLVLLSQHLLAPETQRLQTNILGLPWWVWLLGLIIVIILLYLLLRPAPPEVEPFVEVKTTPVAEQPAEAPTPESPISAPAEEETPLPEGPFTAAPSPYAEDMMSLDDLTIVEGIGPKISGVLREAGIDTFKKLAATSPARISEILKAAGITLFDPSSWPEQASLIAEARWTELRALQEKLIAGRRE
jgi:predicted flap endonuclease-1-like 5' DNA nuclease